MLKNFDYKKYYDEVMAQIRPFSSYYSSMAFKGELRRFTIIREMLGKKAQFDDSLKLIDLGCGGGLFLLMMEKFKGELTGVDISGTVIKGIEDFLNKKGIKCNLVSSDIRKTSFKEESFDIAICSEVLEHIESPEEAIRETERILKKGGTLMVSVPFKEDIQYTICTHCYQKTPFYGHFYYFDKKKLQELLGKNGFDVVSMRLAYSVLPLVFYSYLPYFLWSPLDIFFQSKIIGRSPAWIVAKGIKR